MNPRSETEARIALNDEYNDVEMIWTFKTGNRQEFISNVTKMWDWFMNDPIPDLNTVFHIQEVEENETPEDG
jgi:hypothetical protein